MTEPMDELDRQATHAAAELRRVAAERGRPAFDPNRIPTPAPAIRSPLRAPLLLSAAAIVLLVGAVAVLQLRDSDEPEVLTAGRAGDIPAYVLDPPPDGFIAMAMDLDGIREADDADERAVDDDGSYRLDLPWYLYGPVDGPARVAIIVDPGGFDPSAASDEWGEDPEVFDLDGRRAYRDGDFALHGANSVVVEVDGAAVAVAGGADGDLIDAIAGATTIDDGAPVIDPSVLPEGWAPLGTTDRPALGLGYLEPTASKVVFYAAAQDGDVHPVTDEDGRGVGLTMAQVVVGAVPEEQAPDLTGVLPALKKDSTDVEVDGGPATLVTMPGDGDETAYTVDWEPEPGRSVTVLAYGFDLEAEDVVALAETARPATDEEWQTLLDEMRRAEATDYEEHSESGTVTEFEDGTVERGPEDTTPEADGEAPGPFEEPMTERLTREPIDDLGLAGRGGRPGLSWEAHIDDGVLSIVIEGAERGRAHSVAIDQPFEIASAAFEEGLLIGGVIGTDQLVTIEGDGEPVESRWSIRLPDGRELWVAEVGAGEIRVTLLDRDGTELREQVADYATP